MKIIKKIIMLIILHGVVMAIYAFSEDTFRNYIKPMLLEFQTLMEGIKSTKRTFIILKNRINLK